MKLNIGKLFHHCSSESPFWLIMFGFITHSCGLPSALLPQVSSPPDDSSSLRFLLLQARTFTSKVSFPMGIFALYIMFTTYAAPLASLITPRPSFFVSDILLFTRCLLPFSSIPSKRRLTFRVVLQDEAYARPSCLRRLPSTLVNVPYSVSAPECDSYKPLWTPSDRGSGVRRLDNNPKRAWACERSYGR